jgi:hypothetical protein
MGLPVVANTPANNLISATTSGTQTRVPTAGETAIVWGVATSGGAGLSVSGAGGTWTEILNVSDGTRRAFAWRGSGITSGSSQTVTVSFTNTTTCRWSWLGVTGISSTTPDDQTGDKTTSSSARTSTDCVSTAVTTPANVVCVAGLGLSATPSTITGITGWTRVTAVSGASIALLYIVSAGGLSSDSISVTHASVTSAGQGGFASFNGDDQGGGGGQPYAKRLGGVPHNGFRRRGMW